jgi:hypothetical protein
MTYAGKLARAEEHFATFNADLDRYIADDETFTVRAEASADGKEHAFLWTLHKDPPAEWSPLIGDVLHNLRCALDHIVWQLADPDVRGKNTMFPIFTDPGEFFRTDKKGRPGRGSGLRKLEGLLPDPLAIIEAAQPYNWTDGPDHPGEALRVLNEIENIDKHQFLHTAAASGQLERTEFPSLGRATVRVTLNPTLLVVGEETETISIEVPSREAAVDMKVNVSFLVLFADTGEVDGTPVDVALEGLISAVRLITDDLKLHLP